MTAADWRELMEALVERRIEEAAFHDGFLARWRDARDRGQPLPAAVDRHFYVVEVYCPDPALRAPPGSRHAAFEADSDELRRSTEQALAALSSPCRD